MTNPTEIVDKAKVGPAAAELERLREHDARLYDEFDRLWRDGTERRRNGATLEDIAPINERLTQLRSEQIGLGYRIQQLELDAENETHGWTRLPDGSSAKILPSGEVLSAYGGATEFTDGDGKVYTETAEDRRWKDERHKAVALAFKAKVTSERIALAWRRAPAVRPTRPGRVTVARRSRTSTRTTMPSRGDPQDDPESEPPAGPSPRFSRPWRHVDDQVAARRAALSQGEQLRLDRGEAS